MSTTANDLTLYDRLATTWWEQGSALNALSHFNEPRFAYFDRFVARWDGLRVLDVGCGGGFTAEHLARRGAVMAGLDQSEGSIHAARLHAADSGLEIDYRHGVAEALPFGDASFDVVCCVDVLEHVADVQQVLSEARRVLRPGGVFLFDTINRTVRSRLVMITLLEGVMKEIPRGAHDWSKFIRPVELTAMLKQTGFVDFDLKGFDVKGRDKKTGRIRVNISERMPVMYIGKAAVPTR